MNVGKKKLATLIVCAIICSVSFSIKLPIVDADMPTVGGGWLDGWAFRKSINITGSQHQDLVNYTFTLWLYSHLAGDGFVNISGVGGGALGLKGRANTNMSDIRFTSDDGETLIDYFLAPIVTRNATDEYSDRANQEPTYAPTGSQMVYDPVLERTYVAYPKSSEMNYQPALRYYDHISGLWSVETAFYKGITTDHHENPTIFIDSEGFIHVMWGAHGTQLYYAKSSRPGDITNFTTSTPPVASTVSYPRMFETENGTLYIVYRNLLAWDFIRSYDRGKTWTDLPYSNIEALTSGTAYVGDVEYRGGSFHFFAKLIKPQQKHNQQHTFYYRYDIDNRTVYNVNGDVLGQRLLGFNSYFCTISNVSGNASFTNGMMYNGVPYAIIGVRNDTATGTDPANYTSGHYLFAKWTGTEWYTQYITDRVPINNTVPLQDIYVNDVNNIDVYFPTDAGENNTNMEKWTSSDGGVTWSQDTVIISNTSLTWGVSSAKICYTWPGIKGFHSSGDMIMQFSEFRRGDNIHHKVWAHGDSGFKTINETYAECFVNTNIPLGKVVTIFMYYGNVIAPMLTTDIGMFPLFGGYGTSSRWALTGVTAQEMTTNKTIRMYNHDPATGGLAYLWYNHNISWNKYQVWIRYKAIDYGAQDQVFFSLCDGDSANRIYTSISPRSTAQTKWYYNKNTVLTPAALTSPEGEWQRYVHIVDNSTLKTTYHQLSEPIEYRQRYININGITGTPSYGNRILLADVTGAGTFDLELAYVLVVEDVVDAPLRMEIGDSNFVYANIDSPTTGSTLLVSNSINFYATTSKNGDWYFWTWGDGTTTNTSMKNTSHTYVATGTYTVTLLVGNNSFSQGENRDTDSIILTITTEVGLTFVNLAEYLARWIPVVIVIGIVFVFLTRFMLIPDMRRD